MHLLLWKAFSLIYIGVDPGGSGAIAAIRHWSLSGVHDFIKNKQPEAEIARFVNGLAEADECVAIIERVHSMPAQGVASSFKFGQSFGFLIGVIVTAEIPYKLVQPVKWMDALNCRTGGDKNVTKNKAMEMFPEMKITHANADALLIAEYCRRTNK